MSDGYAEHVRSEGGKLVERFIDLEVEHQARLARSRMRRTYAGTEYEDDFHWTHEEELRQLRSYSDEYRGEIASWFTDLEEIFDELAQLPEPEALRGKANELRTALTKLAGPAGRLDTGSGEEYAPYAAYDRLHSIDTYLVDWNGLAADAFKSNFIPPLPRVVHHEFSAVATLKSALLAEAAMWERARDDVKNLITETDGALDAYEDSKDSADAVLALTIIGAIVAVAAVPATGGTSAALYWALAGSAVSVTGAVVGHPDEEKTQLPIKGDSPAEICNSMREAIWDMKYQWVIDEIFIRDRLQILSDQIAGYTLPPGTAPEDVEPRPRYGYHPGYSSTDHTYNEDTVHQFMLPRPALADATSGNVTDDDHMGKPEV